MVEARSAEACSGSRGGTAQAADEMRHDRSSIETRDCSGATASAGGRALALMSALTGLAGFLDAAAYIQLNHLYVSFMSGNSTHLGMSLGAQNLPSVVSVLVIVGFFVAGAGVGTRIADRVGPDFTPHVLGAEAGILGIAAGLSVVGLVTPALVLVAGAMGLQNVLHRRVAGADLGKGFITGALFEFGQSLARLFQSDREWRRAAANLWSWLVFVIGAAAGTLAQGSFGLVFCLVIACILIAAMAALVVARAD